MFYIRSPFVAGYATFDEIHQWFTGDRTPMWQDSLLDTCGGLTGIVISNWFWTEKGANPKRLAPFVYTPSNSLAHL